MHYITAFIFSPVILTVIMALITVLLFLILIHFLSTHRRQTTADKGKSKLIVLSLFAIGFGLVAIGTYASLDQNLYFFITTTGILVFIDVALIVTTFILLIRRTFRSINMQSIFIYTALIIAIIFFAITPIMYWHYGQGVLEQQRQNFLKGEHECSGSDNPESAVDNPGAYIMC